MAGLTNKGKIYYALFPVNGKTKWKRIGNMPYKDAVQALKKLETSFDKDRLSIRTLAPYFGNMLLEAIDNESVEFYKVKRQTEGVKQPRTINIEFLCASNMLRMAIEWHYLKHTHMYMIKKCVVIL